MSSLESHPIYTLLFIFLVVAYIIINKYTLGKNLKCRKAYNLTKYDGVALIDIRPKERYERFHIKNSINDQNPNNLRIYKDQSVKKIAIIYDSNISLTMYQKLAKIEKFPDDVYCIYMPDYQVFSNKNPNLNALQCLECEEACQ